MLEFPARDSRETTIEHALDAKTTPLHLERVVAGFAGAEKYIVRSEAGEPLAFAKLISNTAPAHEVAAARVEIRNYELLKELGLCGDIFPDVLATIDDETYTGLLLSYYNDVTWAGPWNESTIRALHSTFKRIHASDVSPGQIAKLKETKEILGEQGNPTDLYDKARMAFADNKRTIINSRNQVIFHAESDDLFNALFNEKQTPHDDREVLVVRDVNKYNICFDGSTPHLVDPVYLDMGNSYQDLFGVAHDIIGQLPGGSPEIDLVKELYVPQDRHNKFILDGIAFGLVATLGPYEDNKAWMNYQQESLLIRLSLWHEL